MSRDMEMSCDEAVLRKTDEDIRCDYSTSLLSLSTKRVSLLNPIAFSVGEGSVKDRIANVLKFKKSSSWVTAVSVVVVGVFLVGFSSDRILAVEAPSNVSGSTLMSPSNFDIDTASWHTDEQGARIASPEEAHEIGTYILNKYFLAFQHDWEAWGSEVFYLTAHYAEIDWDGNPITPWLFGSVSEDLGEGRFFTPPFTFFINAETGGLNSTNFFPPTSEYIASPIAPFDISIGEALSLYGDLWFATPWDESTPAFSPLPPLEMNNEYKDLLIDFSLALLNESGFPRDSLTSIDSNFSGSFANGFANVNILASFTSGKQVVLSFWVFDTHFTITGFAINY